MYVPRQEYDNGYPFHWCVWAYKSLFDKEFELNTELWLTNAHTLPTTCILRRPNYHELIGEKLSFETQKQKKQNIYSINIYMQMK